MNCRFVYDWISPLEVSDRNLIGVYEPVSTSKATADNAALIAAGFAAPVGAPQLRSAVKPSEKVLILSDDISRPTPVHLLMPAILEELAAAGVPDANISFLMSLGTHRAMSDAEIDSKLGSRIRQYFAVDNHRWDDDTIMVDMGQSASGTPILVNRRLTEADFVIGVGNIVPHPAAGFAGGGKIVDPGCVSDVTCGAFHWESVKLPARDVVGVRDNPMIAMIDDVARRAGLRYIVNTILDAKSNIVRVVTGDPVEAHREGCRTAVSVYGVRIPERADIVVCDSHPADIEMWQAIKGLCTADLCLKDGGTVIMATPCPEGASPEHPELERYGYRNFRETSKLVENGSVSMVVGHHMVQGGRLLERARKVVLVSNHLDASLAGRLHMAWAPSIEHAFHDAMKAAGPDARVVFLRNAAELFPVIG